MKNAAKGPRAEMVSERCTSLTEARRARHCTGKARACLEHRRVSLDKTLAVDLSDGRARQPPQLDVG
jgi:hypothetical protein